MKRTDGLNFPSGSVLKIKNNSAGGTVIKSLTLSNPASTVNINLTESTTWNISGGTNNSNNFQNYVVTWFNPTSSINFYTRQIKIVAVPTGWGTFVSSYNNVPVYSNGWGGFLGTDFLTDSYGQKFQFVHYIKIYYKVVKNKSLAAKSSNQSLCLTSTNKLKSVGNFSK